jgi:hypothetical protein
MLMSTARELSRSVADRNVEPNETRISSDLPTNSLRDLPKSLRDGAHRFEEVLARLREYSVFMEADVIAEDVESTIRDLVHDLFVRPNLRPALVELKLTGFYPHSMLEIA